MRVRDIKLSNRILLLTEIPLRFYIGLPLAAKSVEVVDQVTAHERLHCVVDVPYVHAFAHHLCPIHIRKNLWHVRQIARNNSCNLRTLLGGLHKFEEIVGEELLFAARAILQHEGHAP